MVIEPLNSKPNPRFSRRDFLKLMKIASFGILVAAVGNSIKNILETDWIEINQIPLVLPRLPASFNGLRLAQISDIHLGGWMNVTRMKHAFDVLESLKPDLIAITGDFIMSSRWYTVQTIGLPELEQRLKRLTMEFPTLAVLGNHEHRIGRTGIITDLLNRSGVRTLMNDVHEIKNGYDSLTIAGVDDVFEGFANLDRVMSLLPQKGCAIMLAHEPDFADKSATTGRFDLQLSGHSHGGQVILPFLGSPVLPELGRKYPMGLYKIGDMYQYTNRGVGRIRPSIRINCMAEITVFTFQSQSQPDKFH